jgi:hypothetical protein
MRGFRSGFMAVLLVLPFAPATLSATSTIAKDALPVEFRLLPPSTVQFIETAGFDAAIPKSQVEMVAHPDGPLENLAYVSAATQPSAALATDDPDYLQDSPRSKMRKWFFAILLVGGLVRYLSSDSYRRFVSDVLDPLNW